MSRSHVSTVLLSSLAALCVFGSGWAQSGVSRELSIQSGKLSEVLRKLADQVNLQVVFYVEDTQEKTAGPLRGRYTPEQALERLLKDSGLEFQYVDAQTISVKRRAAAGLAAAQAGEAMQVAQAETSSPPSPVAGEGAPKGADEGKKESAISEIVVTAQKREERLNDVPISISVLNGSDLDKSTVQGIAGALRAVPGVVTQESYIGGGTQITIRGVSASSTILHGSSPVAYYVDSVPFGLIKNSVAPDANAYDMERVEVLRGPQGTLYGASALNGVVRILTKDADLNGTEFKARLSGSNTASGGGNYRGDAAFSMPIIEGKLAARAVVGHENDSGWIDRPNHHDANDAELRNYRLKINAQPMDQLSIGLSLWSSRSDFGSPNQALTDGTNTAPVDEPMFTDYDTYGLKVNYDFAAFSVTSTSSYLNYKNGGALEMTPFGIPPQPVIGAVLFTSRFFGKVFAQEININSLSQGNWRWSVGGIYRDEKDRNNQRIDPIIVPQDFNDTSKSYAVFGELTRMFLDRRLELTAGFRHFKDDVGTKENISNTGVPGTPLIDVRSQFHKTSPRVVLNWHPDPNLTAYASYAEGFRSGFQQIPQVIASNPQIPPVGADKLRSYELGAKGSALNGRVAFDTAVYYITWHGVQSDNAIVIDDIPYAALVNGPPASGVGIDLALKAEPVSHLQLGLNFSTNNLSWDRDALPASQVQFHKGDRLNLSPKYTAGASVDYAFPVGQTGFEWALSASATYNSSQFIRINTGNGEGDSILITRASLSLSSPTHWTASLFGDNLNNEDGAIQQAPFSIPLWTVRPRPRTVGLQLEYHF